MSEIDQALISIAQRILEDQGYVIVAGIHPRSAGTVLENINGGLGYGRLPGPLVVIGESTRREWQEQKLKYTGITDRNVRESYFYKVVAE